MDVSVIIPIYKGNGYIESLLNKIEKNYQESQKEIEVIFVNDYPDEEIIVGSQHDFPIRIINNEMNQGIHQTRINGLKKAIGKYILFLDQDDEISDFFRPYGMDSRCMLTIGEARFPLEGGRIPLCPRAFGLDTIVLDLEGERRAALVDRSGRERVVVECPDFPYLGLWTADKPFDTGYFCIEPWSALPDAVFVGRGLGDKAGIRRLEPGGVHVLTYTTTFQ